MGIAAPRRVVAVLAEAWHQSFSSSSIDMLQNIVPSPLSYLADGSGLSSPQRAVHQPEVNSWRA